MKIFFFLLTVIFIVNKSMAQDIIYLSSGEEVKAKVLEVKVDMIIYKKFDNLEGPVFQQLKKEIFMIKYENGTKDVFGIAETKTTSTGNMSNEEICIQAVKDANTNYRAIEPIIGTYIPSMLVMPAGLVTAIIVAPRPPKVKNLNITDPALLQNQQYMNCYMQQSSKIKKKKTWMAFGSGWVTGMALATLILTTSH